MILFRNNKSQLTDVIKINSKIKLIKGSDLSVFKNNPKAISKLPSIGKDKNNYINYSIESSDSKMPLGIVQISNDNSEFIVIFPENVSKEITRSHKFATIIHEALLEFLQFYKKSGYKTGVIAFIESNSIVDKYLLH